MLKLKAFLFSGLFLIALTAGAQVSFGVKAGLNLSNITNFDDSQVKVGYKVGPSMQYSFQDNMAIQTALLLSSKGVKFDHLDGKIDANYLELPISFAYKFPISYDTNVYVNAGPYFALGIFGKTSASVLDTEHHEDTFGSDRAKEFDFGFTFGVGMEVSQFNFGVNYDLGVTEVYDHGSHRNGNFWVSVGYQF
ncbi:MAG: PorT family protein [Candidatus Azobacteroides sp.]|nr:PorT family protein [Candidatus Azobacteroides sp.]